MALGNVQIEISGVCNAKCPYCVTGQKNRMGQETGGFLKLEEFKDVIYKLEEKNIIDFSTIISLYNYGEPFLSPYFSDIIYFLEERGYWYDISTNASVLVDDEILHRMKHLIKMQFSICGMSQESYDKIHGFNKNRILCNISKMVKEIHSVNKNAECLLKLQMYKFNKKEYDEALRFSKDNGMTVIPLHAIYANLQQQINMVSEYLANSGYDNDDLILDYMDELLAHGDRETCIEHDSLVIDERLNVALCCMITKEMPEYYWKTLNEICMDDIEKRKNCDYCMKCINSGVSSSICNTPSYKGNLINQINVALKKNKNKKVIVVGDDILTNSFFKYFSQEFEFEHKRDLDCVENDCMYVFASKKWWQYVERYMDGETKEEYADYIVYNTYIR